MKTISQYKTEISDFMKELGAITAKAVSENRDLSDTELALKKQTMDRVDGLRRQVEILEREEELSNQLTTHNGPVTLDRNPAGTIEIRDRDKFKTFGEQMMAIIRASVPGGTTDPRLNSIMAAATGLGTEIPSDGGFLVQQDFAPELLKDVYETGRLISQVRRRISLSGNANSITINGYDETSRANGSRRGGVIVYRINEADTITPSKPKFRQIELKPKKLAGLVYLTSEMIGASSIIESEVRQCFVDEMAYSIDDEMYNGTGAGQMLGVKNAGCLVSVAKETGQKAKTIMAENIINMYARMFATSMNTANWYINQDVLPELFKLKIDVGTGGQLVYMPPAGLSQAPYGTLLGRPVVPIEQAQTLGTKMDIAFCDFANGYVLCDKGDIRSDMSIHVAFVTDQQAFRFVLMNDGQPIRATYMTPAKGTNYQSHFVTLDARA